MQAEGAVTAPAFLVPQFAEFGGEWDRTIDDKGRIVIPPEHRAGLVDGARIRVWNGPCIGVFPMPYFRMVAAELRQNIREGLGNRGAHQSFWSRSEQATPDSQGRVFVPEKMRLAASIDREVVLTGAGPIIQLWPADRWAPIGDDGEAAIHAHVETGLGLF